MTNTSKEYQPVGETLEDTKRMLDEAATLSRGFVPSKATEQYLAEIIQKLGAALDNVVKVIESTSHTHHQEYHHESSCRKCKGSKSMRSLKMTTTTDTPRTDACPHCGDEPCAYPHDPAWQEYRCGTVYGYYPSDLCREREARQKAEAEVERLRDALQSCWHCANTYDGDYTKACDNVMLVASNALRQGDHNK
jgi:hypothetical protein